MSEKMFHVGKIVNTHGIDGEVKVYRLTDFEDRFNIGESIYLVKEGKATTKLSIKTHRRHKGMDLLSFVGYESIDDVESFKGAYLSIDETQLTDLDEYEYYYYEIIDCTVYTTSNEYIGIVKEILAPGANDVFSVKRDNEKEVLIPNIKDVVKKIDIKSKEIIIEPMEGLLD